MSKPDLIASLKNISARDRTQIAKAQEMLGPDPTRMGFIKSIFWGNFREELVFPFPEVNPDETARCDQLLAGLDQYLRHEHPADQGQRQRAFRAERHAEKCDQHRRRRHGGQVGGLLAGMPLDLFVVEYFIPVRHGSDALREALFSLESLTNVTVQA